VRDKNLVKGPREFRDAPRWLAQKAERRNPPIGRFITVDGVRLHYVERGTGNPLVLLHGNGSMIRLSIQRLIDLAAQKHRVIAIDRPVHRSAGHTLSKSPQTAIQLLEGLSVDGDATMA
jgi:pimeloyl-ACP methyl ester carboxylesterase